MKLSIIGPELNVRHPAGLHVVRLAQTLARYRVKVRIYTPDISMTLPEEILPSVKIIKQGNLNPVERRDFISSDVCIYYLPGSEPWLSEIKHLQHAIVILDCHTSHFNDSSRWLYYADLYFCLLYTSPSPRD